MNIYQNLYDLVHQYVFGSVEMTANMDLVAVFVATLGCLFVIGLPFAIVIKVIKLIVG